RDGEVASQTPLGEVFKRALFGGSVRDGRQVTKEAFATASRRLMADDTIDVDFRRIVVCYWRTFLPPGDKDALSEETRSTVLQWFAGEGTVALFRRQFQVQKVVGRENAKLMLRSLARFAAHIGYQG